MKLSLDEPITENILYVSVYLTCSRSSTSRNKTQSHRTYHTYGHELSHIPDWIDNESSLFTWVKQTYLREYISILI